MSTRDSTGTTALVIANVSETYPAGHGKSGVLATNPLALAPDGTSFVLARPAHRVSWADFGDTPAATVSIALSPTGLSSALLEDEAARAKLLNRFVDAGPIRLLFQVWSEPLADLVRALAHRGVVFDDGSIPTVSGATVAFWNTKRGGRELLQSIPGLHEYLPNLEFCSNANELRQMLSARTEPCVVKPNMALGGEGIALIAPGEIP